MTHDEITLSPTPSADETFDDADHERRMRGRRRRVAITVVSLMVASVGLYGASPWLLPAWLDEGPLVQQATGNSAVLVWYTSRQADCSLTVAAPAGAPQPTVQVSHRELRCRAEITNLQPASAYAYRILVGDRDIGGGTLKTNKPSGAPFSFLVFGDSGKGTTEQFRLAAQMTALEPDLVVHTGDLIYSGGERYRYKSRFFRPYADLLASVAFWPSLGNHDVSEPDFGDPYREVFDLPENGPAGQTPENHYWFDYADARFLVIDSNCSQESLTGAVTPWARQVLAAPGPRWRFAVMHHPPYTAGKHRPALGVREALVPVFDETGVDVAFFGHDHMYQRSHALRGGAPAEGGTVYIVTGAGGAALYEIRQPEVLGPVMAVANNSVHSFTVVRVAGDTLELEQIDLEGRSIDRWSITKPSATPAGPE